MKVVFLDFDGVLVNHNSWYQRSGLQAMADPACVAALNRITEATGAVIVVSSAWRLGQTPTELRKLLKQWGVKASVVGKTPASRADVRGREIAKWLADCRLGVVESFVILDDDNDMEHLKAALVQTQFDAGLTEEDADKAIAVLGRGMEDEAAQSPAFQAGK